MKFTWVEIDDDQFSVRGIAKGIFETVDSAKEYMKTRGAVPHKFDGNMWHWVVLNDACYWLTIIETEDET